MGGEGHLHDVEFQECGESDSDLRPLSYYMMMHPNVEMVTTWLLAWDLQHEDLRAKDSFWLYSNFPSVLLYSIHSYTHTFD